MLNNNSNNIWYKFRNFYKNYKLKHTVSTPDTSGEIKLQKPSNHGLLLINLGTPENHTPKAIRKYLKEFLADKRVIDLPSILRYILLHVIILPFRTKKVSAAYASIWTKDGSPLRVNSLNLLHKIRAKLGDSKSITLGMRYGSPTIKDALSQLKHCDKLTILPLYPQYSSAATGSSIEYVLKQISSANVFPELHIIRDFYSHPKYIQAQAAQIKKYITADNHILFSYHGLPERQLFKLGCKNICEDCPNQINQSVASKCYRAQCFATTQLIAKQLSLSPDKYTLGFQSRLGKTEWIKPYTDQVLENLAAKGIKNLIVVCPSFVADCLETLEEIAIRAAEDWQKMTEGTLTLVPCLNSDDIMVDLICDLTLA